MIFLLMPYVLSTQKCGNNCYGFIFKASNTKENFRKSNLFFVLIMDDNFIFITQLCMVYKLWYF